MQRRRKHMGCYDSAVRREMEKEEAAESKPKEELVLFEDRTPHPRRQFLAATRKDDGKLWIHMVDDNGNHIDGKSIGYITDQGIELHGSIDSDVPFPLSKGGYIKTNRD
jgi:hypothetical protein